MKKIVRVVAGQSYDFIMGLDDTAVWEARCATCGHKFKFAVAHGSLAEFRAPRRCSEHRQSGKRVTPKERVEIQE